MLSAPAPFPHPGSRGFLARSADPVTILRRNADGSCLVRRDAGPFAKPNRDASGNTTVPAGEIFEHETDAARAGLAKRKRKSTGSARDQRAASAESKPKAQTSKGHLHARRPVRAKPSGADAPRPASEGANK